MTAPDLPPTQPLGPTPGTGSGSRTGGPDFDAMGLRYDRGDLEEQPTVGVLPAGVAGFSVTGRARASADVFTVQLKPCCGEVLLGEYCDCAEFAAGLDLAPVIVLPPFDLRRLAEQHVTAAEMDRRERGVGRDAA
ncbi:hypothetical protein OOK41_09265 [Micromonospora sp. NBC_01655]|uniref:hypothetical protein n=1 Tax=Micromonospora sp. NBC_01655 TaxID=2975983 RepID=UPI00225B1566|nr:hypothetical protein [Micromonospora sp. NBC_01655]MCX4470495.1 hypothetical protein [Micromonospora sp. NBC_01655]